MENYNVYTCKDGRTRVYLKDSKRVISYPKFLMEQKLGRKLEANEQVHHLDGNPLNNELDNLAVVKLGDHQREHATKYHDKPIKCAWCEKEFIWTAKQQRRFHGNMIRNRPNNNPFCSKKCVGEYGRFVQTWRCGEIGSTLRT